MRVALFISFLLLLQVSFGQGKYSFQVISSDQPKEFFTKGLSYKEKLKDSLQGVQEKRDLIIKLRTAGYAASSIDSSKADSTKMILYIYVGQKVDNIVLHNGNVDDKLLNDAGVRYFVTSGKPIKITDAETVKDKLLQQCENTGYPFATVKLDSFGQSGKAFTAKIYLEKHDLIRYDTIHILGKTHAKKPFLKSYLGLKPGKPYNETTVKRINQRLAELQFIQVIQPRTIEFVNGKAKVNLFLKDKKASQFDALLGLLPGSSGQKVLITGDAKLHLLSPFGYGEDLYLQWQKLQPKTQTLDIKVTYPYLLGLPLGISVKFNLYKADTSYVDVNGDYGLQYQLIGSDYLRASLKQKITIVTDVDTSYIIQNRTLPPNIDILSNDFALEYFTQRLDYRINPTSGYTLTINGSVGERDIKQNSNITQLYDEVSGRYFSYLYDSIRLKTLEFHLGLTVEKYWRLAARHTIKTNFDGRYFYAPTIFQNEKYRLGGVSSLRGFDDQSIFTPYYAMGNIEYRFLLSKNSFFGAFFNAALVQNSLTQKGFDYPFGFGVTAAIETKAGVFGITYAMGRQLGNKITFNSAKIHFGYVNYF
jgi:outer membrane protein assembly factor BamA